MGRNSQLFQRRKAANEEHLKRKAAFRKANKRVLIVCEGAQTERLYFEALVCALELISVDVEICGQGLAPISLVLDAERRVRAEGPSDDAGYDAVFCVFDRDTHDSFEAAKSRIITLVKEGVFPPGIDTDIYSIPSFEYWFLIHFNYHRAPFTSAGAKSAGDRVIDELKKVPGFENYQKSLAKDVIARLLGLTVDASSNAVKAEKDSLDTGEVNPMTRVHRLVAYLKSLKS